jgi:hypothetical protein
MAARAVETKWPKFPWHRGVCPSFDSTPRRAKGGVVLRGACPDAYEQWLTEIVRQTQQRPNPDPKFLFINAWNEWAEGNHLEPCLKWGRGYLEATSRALSTNGLKRQPDRD